MYNIKDTQVLQSTISLYHTKTIKAFYSKIHVCFGKTSCNKFVVFVVKLTL